MLQLEPCIHPTQTCQSTKPPDVKTATAFQAFLAAATKLTIHHHLQNLCVLMVFLNGDSKITYLPKFLPSHTLSNAQQIYLAA